MNAILEHIPHLPAYLWALGVITLASWAMVHDRVWKDKK